MRKLFFFRGAGRRGSSPVFEMGKPFQTSPCPDHSDPCRALQCITYGTHSKIERPILAFLLFFLIPTFVNGQANVSAPVQHPCPMGVNLVSGHAAYFPSHWQILVICDQALYTKTEKDWKAPQNLGAFTVLEARRTYVYVDLRKQGADLADSVKQTVSHELKHVLCQCTLGEKP